MPYNFKGIEKSKKYMLYCNNNNINKINYQGLIW